MSAPIEKSELEIRFIPIACAIPLMLAHRRGLFEANGLDVALRPAPGWSGIRDLVAHERIDAAHMLLPMPIALHLGLDGTRADARLCAVLNVNGQALTLANKHAGINDIRAMKGFTFAVPYVYSMQFYLLCDLLAKHGLNPLTDVTIREVAPPQMPYYLRHGRIDAVLTPEPYSQIILRQGDGHVLLRSRDIWRGHPCCGFVMLQSFLDRFPNTARAAVRSIISAQKLLREADGAERSRIAVDLSAPGYLHRAGRAVIEQILGGLPATGTAAAIPSNDMIDFLPTPFPEYGTWIVAQMQRWGQLAGMVDYAATTKTTFMSEEVVRTASEAGFDTAMPPSTAVPSPFAFDAPFESMRRQAFCAYLPQPAEKTTYHLAPAVQERLSVILSQIADVSGGRTEQLAVEVTSADSIGQLEHMLNGLVKNEKYAVDALNEQIELEQRALAHTHELLKMLEELSAPIAPVLDGVLVLPLIGIIDDARAKTIAAKALGAVSEQEAKILLIDLTGVPAVDATALDGLVKLVRAVALVGTECAIVGISPAVAAQLNSLGSDLSQTATFGTLQKGVEHALHRLGLRLVEQRSKHRLFAGK